jgi:hypothetical protein
MQLTLSMCHPAHVWLALPSGTSGTSPILVELQWLGSCALSSTPSKGRRSLAACMVEVPSNCTVQCCQAVLLHTPAAKGKLLPPPHTQDTVHAQGTESHTSGKDTKLLLSIAVHYHTIGGMRCHPAGSRPMQQPAQGMHHTPKLVTAGRPCSK